MLAVSQKHIFIENEIAQVCVTMRKRSSTITGTMEYKMFLYKFYV